MLLGAVHGLNLALIHWFSRGVLGGRANGALLAATVVIAAFGPMALSEVGTSFADILTALPVLGGLGLILGSKAGQRSRYAVAGLLIGAAVGLKLTNMIFLVAALVSLLYAAQPATALSCVALGAAIGALGTGGAWGWTLWHHYGNPVFPFFNSVFHSLDAPLAEIADTRFMPRNFWDGAAYPFYWLIGVHPSSEAAFRDPRFAILALIGAAHGCIGLFGDKPRLARRDKQFLLFFAVAYLLWLRTFAIHRYAIALELLAGPLIVMLLARLWTAMPLAAPQQRPRLQLDLATGSVALAIVLWSQPADWSRRAWADSYRPQISASLLSPASYFLIEKPLGYVIPLLPVGSRAYQLADILLPITPGGVLDRRIRAGLADPLPGGTWALHVHGSTPRQDLLDGYDLRFDAARPCEFINGADGADIEACPLIKSEMAAGP